MSHKKKKKAPYQTLGRKTLAERAAQLRNNPTKAEEIVCDRLRRIGYTYYFQKVIGFFIADIVIPSKMVILEVDGAYHATPEQTAKDTRRTEWLEKLGFSIIRIDNKNAETCDLSILRAIRDKDRSLYEDAIADANAERNASNERKMQLNAEAKKAKRKKNRPKSWRDVMRLTKDHLPIGSKAWV